MATWVAWGKEVGNLDLLHQVEIAEGNRWEIKCSMMLSIFLPIHVVIAAHHLCWPQKVVSLSTERASFCHYCRIISNVPPLKIIPCLVESSSVPLSLMAHPQIKRPEKKLSLPAFSLSQVLSWTITLLFLHLFSVKNLACVLRHRGYCAPEVLTPSLLRTRGSDPKLSSPTIMVYFPMNSPTSGCVDEVKPSNIPPGPSIQCKPL